MATGTPTQPPLSTRDRPNVVEGGPVPGLSRLAPNQAPNLNTERSAAAHHSNYGAVWIHGGFNDQNITPGVLGGRAPEHGNFGHMNQPPQQRQDRIVNVRMVDGVPVPVRERLPPQPHPNPALPPDRPPPYHALPYNPVQNQPGYGPPLLPQPIYPQGGQYTKYSCDGDFYRNQLCISALFLVCGVVCLNIAVVPCAVFACIYSIKAADANKDNRKNDAEKYHKQARCCNIAVLVLGAVGVVLLSSFIVGVADGLRQFENTNTT